MAPLLPFARRASTCQSARCAGCCHLGANPGISCRPGSDMGRHWAVPTSVLPLKAESSQPTTEDHPLWPLVCRHPVALLGSQCVDRKTDCGQAHHHEQHIPAVPVELCLARLQATVRRLWRGAAAAGGWPQRASGRRGCRWRAAGARLGLPQPYADCWAEPERREAAPARGVGSVLVA